MTNLYQIGRYGLTGTTGDITRGERTLVEFNRQFSLFPFALQVRQNRFQNLNALLPPYLSNEKIAMLFGILQVSGSIVCHPQIEEDTQCFDGARIAHLDSQRKHVSGGPLGPAWVRALNSDAPFSINQSGKVGVFIAHGIHGRINTRQKQESFVKKSANSANTLPRNGGGNAEPSSRPIESAGVCREHRLTPKGMTCSDLRSNAKRVAEMTIPQRKNWATKSMPENQDASVAQILHMCCVGVNNRRKNGVLYGISRTITA